MPTLPRCVERRQERFFHARASAARETWRSRTEIVLVLLREILLPVGGVGLGRLRCRGATGHTPQIVLMACSGNGLLPWVLGDTPPGGYDRAGVDREGRFWRQKYYSERRKPLQLGQCGGNNNRCELGSCRKCYIIWNRSRPDRTFERFYNPW